MHRIALMALFGLLSAFAWSADIQIHQTHRRVYDGAQSPDSNGSLFAYYRPRPTEELDAFFKARLGWVERLVFGFKRVLSSDTFDRLPAHLRWEYLVELERRVSESNPSDAVYSGANLKLLERRPDLPFWIADQVSLFALPEMAKNSWLTYPGIQSHPHYPATTSEEALRRASVIMAETGHAEVDFDVRFRVPVDRNFDGVSQYFGVWNRIIALETTSANLDGLYASLLIPGASMAAPNRPRNFLVSWVAKALENRPDGQVLASLKSYLNPVSGFTLDYYGRSNGAVELGIKLSRAPFPYVAGHYETEYSGVREMGRVRKWIPGSRDIYPAARLLGRAVEVARRLKDGDFFVGDSIPDSRDLLATSGALDAVVGSGRAAVLPAQLGSILTDTGFGNRLVAYLELPFRHSLPGTAEATDLAAYLTLLDRAFDDVQVLQSAFELEKRDGEDRENAAAHLNASERLKLLDVITWVRTWLSRRISLYEQWIAAHDVYGERSRCRDTVLATYSAVRGLH